MSKNIPSTEQLRAKLQTLPHAAMVKLAAKAGVPFGTLMKIRSGETQRALLDTARAVWVLL